MTRQTQAEFNYFGVGESFVRINENPQAEFLAGATAPARTITRRGSVACDRYEPIERNIAENSGNVVAPRRITARRATHIGDQSVVYGFRNDLNIAPRVASSANVHHSISVEVDDVIAAVEMQERQDNSDGDSISTVDRFEHNMNGTSSPMLHHRMIPSLVPIRQAPQSGSDYSIPTATISKMALAQSNILRNMPQYYQPEIN